MHTKRGKIIAIVGMDGSGKSTVSDFIQKWFTEENIEFIVTKQPNKEIKQLDIFSELLNNQSNTLEFSTIGGLVSWGRLNTQIKEVEPALKLGKNVICERYITDIYAWSLFRGAKDRWIQDWIGSLYKEDALILCDSDPDIINERIRTRNEKIKLGEDKLESISLLVELYRKNAIERKAIIVNTNRKLNFEYSKIKEFINSIL